MKNRKGFTLIELLAVIVILGLLMAIAIPSVTRYITESRKNTMTTTINNYISSVINEVNDSDYTFTQYNTVYAVPIECIAVERGGRNPFGEWHQANDSYWAYVLIQYDSEQSLYRYAFTYKDSAGYGLYPISQTKFKEMDKYIKTGLDLKRPQTGNITSIASLENWQGANFTVDSTTHLQVLESETEGVLGDGINTCTLAQKGSNYADVENDKLNRPQLLTKLIKLHNQVITGSPTLTTSSNNSNDKAGLYATTKTTNGETTYYYRGDVSNNNVHFANLDWKIVRINEDGTIRLILQNTINDNTSDGKKNTYEHMYYSNSSVIKIVTEKWYTNNIVKEGFDSYVSTGIFCEQAKVKFDSTCTSGKATMTEYAKYVPNFQCSTDGNNKGIINSKVGLLTYDELVFAGGYPFQENDKFYLTGHRYFWTMSPAGFYQSKNAIAWIYFNGAPVQEVNVYVNNSLRPVINLNADVKAMGKGTTAEPYVIEIK